jgi:hypothetical protein
MVAPHWIGGTQQTKMAPTIAMKIDTPYAPSIDGLGHVSQMSQIIPADKQVETSMKIARNSTIGTASRHCRKSVHGLPPSTKAAHTKPTQSQKSLHLPAI